MLGDPGNMKLKSASLLRGFSKEPLDIDNDELDEGGEQEADDPERRTSFNERPTVGEVFVEEDEELFLFVSPLFPLLLPGMDEPLRDLLPLKLDRQPFFIKFHSIDCLLAKSAWVASFPRLSVLPKIELVGDQMLDLFEVPLAGESLSLLPNPLFKPLLSVPSRMGDCRWQFDESPLGFRLRLPVPGEARARLLVLRSRH